MNYSTDQRRYFIFYLLITSFLFSLYFSYWRADPIVKRDDLSLINPLRSLTSIGEYIDAVTSKNSVLDIQPIRDLSLFMNIEMFNWTGYSFFHLTNFILFIFSIFLFSRLLQILGFSFQTIIISLLFYSLHPIMVSAVGWISARKHILALVFILLSLISFLKEKKINNLTILFFSLSILSHQIFILFPFWLYIYVKVEKLVEDNLKFVFLSAIACIVFSLSYLKTFYLGMGNSTYQTFSLMENISRFILSSGRAVSLSFFPISISAAYYQGSFLNILGLPILVLTIFIFYKGKANRSSLLWMLLAGLAYAPTYIAFVDNTYLYLPLICLILAINSYLKNNPVQIPLKIQWTILIIVLGLFSVKTIDASQMWSNDLALWQYSYRNEESPHNALLLGSHLIKKDEKLGIDFLHWGAKNFKLVEHKELLEYFLATIYTSSLGIQDKIKILEDCFVDHETYKGYLGLALLEGTDEQMNQGIDMLRKILLHERSYSPSSEGHKIILSIKYLCNHFSGKDVACSKLGIAY